MVIFQGLLTGRVVIKYGSNALTRFYKNGNVRGLNRERIDDIANFGKIFYDRGIELIVVSSGAMVAQMAKENLRQPTLQVKKRQDLATDGQLLLFSAYSNAFDKYGLGLRGPLLVTWHNFRTLKERENLLDRVERGFQERKISVFNTNDAVTSEELVSKYSKYGFTDNDLLAALVAIHCGANSLIIVSEEGPLGSGGGAPKRRALRLAEKNGVRTNLGIQVRHADLERLVHAFYKKP